jgi:hypothetical protein
METLDFILDCIGHEPMPIAQITLATPIGNVWVVQIKDDLYQAQLRESDDFPADCLASFRRGCEVLLTNSAAKVRVRAILGEESNCFNMTLTEEDAAKLAKKTSAVSMLTVQPLFKFEDWTAGAEAQYQQAELLRAGIYERAQPVNTIVKALVTIDAAVERWKGWDGSPEAMPETDLEGNLLSEIEADNRYKFYLECQQALSAIAEKATAMELAEPIDFSELTVVKRRAEIMMICSALGLSPKNPMFARMSVGKISEIWKTIVDLINKADDNQLTAVPEDLVQPADAPEKKPENSVPENVKPNKSRKSQQ